MAKKEEGRLPPGAGAPRGNLNALKHGRYSRQFCELGLLVAASPKVRETLLALADRHDLKHRKAETVAVDILGRILGHAADIAAGRTRKPPFRRILETSSMTCMIEETIPC